MHLSYMVISRVTTCASLLLTTRELLHSQLATAASLDAAMKRRLFCKQRERVTVRLALRIFGRVVWGEQGKLASLLPGEGACTKAIFP